MYYFIAILDSMYGAMEVPGIITGKQSNNGMYIPNIYSKSQSDWVNNFYKQNGYLGVFVKKKLYKFFYFFLLFSIN